MHLGAVLTPLSQETRQDSWPTTLKRSQTGAGEGSLFGNGLVSRLLGRTRISAGTRPRCVDLVSRIALFTGCRAFPIPSEADLLAGALKHALELAIRCSRAPW